MPIAAKFSETFYEKFGHQATGELVEYLNTIDAGYRAELERLNNANWARFEARLEQRCSQIEAKIDQLRAEVRADMAGLKAELLKWMFLFWVGTMGTVLAMLKL